VILDPNADFGRVRKTVDKSRWEKPAYDDVNHRGFLPHEPSKEDFAQRWKSISTLVQGWTTVFYSDVIALAFFGIRVSCRRC
jgi:hypothetical protein